MVCDKKEVENGRKTAGPPAPEKKPYSQASVEDLHRATRFHVTLGHPKCGETLDGGEKKKKKERVQTSPGG